MKRLLPFVLMFALLAGACQGHAGCDALLKLDGVDGEPADSPPKRKDWIELLSFSTSFKPGSVGAAGAVSSLDLAKLTDKSSPALSERCATGTMLPTARLELLETTPSLVRFFDIRMSNVVISAFSLGTSCATPSTVPTESFSLNYSRITWTYTVRRMNSRLPQELRSADWNFSTQAGAGVTNAASFTMTGIQLGRGEVVLNWQGVAGRTYDIYACPSLTGPFSLQTQVIAPTSEPMSHTAPILPGALFYVVEERP